MDIIKIINENRIDLHLKAKTKDEALWELAELLENDGALASKEEFIKDVYLREEAGPTGLENHIAIPHGKSAAVLKTSLAIGRTKNEIDWETLDGKPVHCIILFAVRLVDQTTTHVKLLSQVASALADEDTVNFLLTEQDPTKIINLFDQRQSA
ncbi:PTS sugar transporter subunit IIA [Priestia megaterium]|jgi:PTS system fructose-specific IIA component|uniref:PTS sugar transporter subunit IIA n=1 Tax=Priestia megaterium TaxID=1404 RepID=UPI00249B5DA4|nr:PTS sugar transporter subunit IIA [Priestia megaterium]MDI3089705.1 PTS sugar transporter subunit IIA [Priestia megaterium]